MASHAPTTPRWVRLPVGNVIGCVIFGLLALLAALGLGGALIYDVDHGFGFSGGGAYVILMLTLFGLFALYQPIVFEVDVANGVVISGRGRLFPRSRQRIRLGMPLLLAMAEQTVRNRDDERVEHVLLLVGPDDRREIDRYLTREDASRKVAVHAGLLGISDPMMSR